MGTFTTVIASNRLPVSVSKIDGKLSYEASNGGLATAMASLDIHDKIWVGWPGIDSDELTEEDKHDITAELEKRGCYPVFLTKEQTALYYEGYANDTIWPLFHYFQSLARYDEKYWQAYKDANQLFSEVLSSVSAPDAKVWIHDYHLMLLPQILREQMPRLSIGFFLHIPFPSFEIFRLLPERKEILRGLLGSDLIGFHIYDYGRHFISSSRRLLGKTVNGDMIEHNDRLIKIAAFPIGIDYDKFRRQLETKETKTAIKSLENSYKGQKLILSVDRLDYSKGIIERLESFAALLKEYPNYIGQVKLLMIAVPSRTEVYAYKKLRDQIEKTVSRINGTYGTVGWAPISYQFQNRPFAEIVALFARADIALVTPIRDGMNLVAKEYVAAKKKPEGVLILSEMAGAIDELPEAITINPNNVSSIKNAIITALEMPKKEQYRRIDAMQRRLKIATVQNWGSEFISSLSHSVHNHDSRYKKRLLPAEKRRIVTRFESAQKRLIILDYDGTLKSFVKVPTALAGAPTLRTRRVIRALSEDPNNVVAIVSGRPRKALTRWFGGVNVVLAAEHGAWTRYDKKWQKIDNRSFAEDKKQIRKFMQQYTERTSGSEIEEKDYALVWHYINVEPDLAFKRVHELQRELRHAFENQDISIDEGHNIIEVKPKSISKGTVVKELLRRFPSDFVLCAGDDNTDEDMFAVLDDDIYTTIKIGGGDTKARYQLENVSQTLDLLNKLAPESTRAFSDLTNQLPDAKGIVRRLLGIGRSPRDK